jgi:hypothetical protein
MSKKNVAMATGRVDQKLESIQVRTFFEATGSLLLNMKMCLQNQFRVTKIIKSSLSKKIAKITNIT